MGALLLVHGRSLRAAGAPPRDPSCWGADVRDPDDHYAALGVDPAATREEIREAWRFRLTAFHPDRFRDAGQRSRAEEITKAANAAWQTLGDAGRRRRYDLRRRGGGDGAIPAQAPPRAADARAALPLLRHPQPACRTPAAAWCTSPAPGAGTPSPR